MDVRISKKYLVLPVNPAARLKKLLFFQGEKLIYDLDCHLDMLQPRHLYYLPVEPLCGLNLTLRTEPEMDLFLEQSDDFQSDSLCPDPYRPRLHFTARQGWLNDPNGLFFLDNQYHMFFQYNPAGASWGNMHWGHAVSSDLVHWQELEPALYPDVMGTMFSGSAYIDDRNSSDLQQAAKPPVLLFYTAAGDTSRLSAGQPYRQCLAYSLDQGRTFVKYPGNPLVEQLAQGNRDPKVVYSPELDAYVMALYLEKNEYVLLTSDDLLAWHELQRIFLDGDAECPDFYRLSVENEPAVSKWVFSGASDKYLVGSINADKRAFVPEQPVQAYYYGMRGSYAAQTFEHTGDRRIRMTWQAISSSGSVFASQMSLPCELALVHSGDRYYLKTRPVPELRQLRQSPMLHLHPLQARESLYTSVPLPARAYEIIMKIRRDKLVDFSFALFGLKGVIDSEKLQISIDDITMPLSLSDGDIVIEWIIDTCGYELFADGGLVYSAQSVISDYNLNRLMLQFSQPASLDELVIYPLQDIQNSSFSFPGQDQS